MTTPHTTVFDWRRHRVGPPRPCLLCGRPALMRNEDDQPCHKVCAEQLGDQVATNLNHRQVSAA